MSRRFVAGVASLMLVLGFACTAMAEDADAQMQAMMENHKAMSMKMADMTSNISAMMEMHASMMKADKTMKSQMGATTNMAKDMKQVSATFTKMSGEMDKMKGMKPMDPSKMDPKLKELHGKIMQDEKDLIAIMQKDVDMMGKMMPAQGDAAPSGTMTK